MPPSKIRSLATFLTATCVSFFMSNTSSSAAPQNLGPRKSPPVIILKLDDLSQPGKHPSAFETMAKIIEEKHIKGSFGLICAVTWPGATPLSESNQEYLDWLKKLNAAGNIEIWFHGWDHAGHDVNGEKHNEFNGRTFEEQKERFERGQKLAQEKLGFVFHTFGPGGGPSKYPTFDDATLQALQAEPNMKVFLYPSAIDDKGKKLEAQGKVKILDRVWDMNLEKAVGVPMDIETFKQNYAKHPDREYFVLQGHPNCWDVAKFEQVTKIIDFLIAEKAVFMTPSEFAAKKKK